MPGCARKEIVREGEVATYHCWSRCVQRAHLCGFDRETGQDFDHRRAWAEDLLAYQARVFAIDVGNFNLLSNHAHHILRTRPDIAESWSHEELAVRWKMAWPELRDGQWVREPSDQEIEALLCQPEHLEQIRGHLGSLSWFMARWKEPIARLCNAEMKTSGHFWEARFGCRELVDDAALLTCNLYLDLNQLRAGMAESLEASRHSAIRHRILAAKEREARLSLAAFAEASEADRHVFLEADAQGLFADCWLAPLGDEGPLLTADSLPNIPGDFEPTATGLLLRVGAQQGVSADEVTDPREADRAARQSTPPESTPPETTPPETTPPETTPPGASQDAPEWRTTAVEPPSLDLLVQEEGQPQGKDSERSPAGAAPAAAAGQQAGGPPRGRIWPRLTRPRASDAPLMAVAWAEYQRVLLALATATLEGSAALDSPVVAGGGGESLAAVLERWGMQPEAWLAGFQQFERRCARAMGAPSNLRERAAQVGRRWLRGIGWCREIFLDRPRRRDAFT